MDDNYGEKRELDLSNAVEIEWKICLVHGSGENNNESAMITVGWKNKLTIISVKVPFLSCSLILASDSGHGVEI